MHILSPETDNCPSWISGRERMTIEIFHDQSLLKNVAALGWGQTCDLLVSSRTRIQLSHQGRLFIVLLIMTVQYRLSIDYVQKKDIFLKTYNGGILINKGWMPNVKQQGPVVQSVVSLTSSLRVISLTVLADSIYDFLKFFAEKMWVAFALQKLLTFFQQKISAYLLFTWFKF